MVSRYDFMTESDKKDTDGETYPDPLSIQYNDVQFTKIPTAVQLTAADLSKFWLFMYKKYGVSEYDDILLNINGIPYIGGEEPGDILFEIDLDDLKSFNTQKINGLED